MVSYISFAEYVMSSELMLSQRRASQFYLQEMVLCSYLAGLAMPAC